jgi:hypothetical protein
VTSTRSDVTVNGYVRADVPRLTPDTGLARAAFVIIRTDEGRVPVVPHKSTYFYPKMYTGLTIQKL